MLFFIVSHPFPMNYSIWINWKLFARLLLCTGNMFWCNKNHTVALNKLWTDFSVCYRQIEWTNEERTLCNLIMCDGRQKQAHLCIFIHELFTLYIEMMRCSIKKSVFQENRTLCAFYNIIINKSLTSNTY